MSVRHHNPTNVNDCLTLFVASASQPCLSSNATPSAEPQTCKSVSPVSFSATRGFTPAVTNAVA